MVEAKTQTRLEKWDNVKLFLILCVVIGHILSKQLNHSLAAKQVYYCIYLFHMPAFVIVSGLFAKRTIREKNYDKAFRFLLLYLFIQILLFGERFLVQGDRELSLFSVTGAAWYALAMFAFYLMTMYLQRYSKWYVLVLSVIVSCAAGYDPAVTGFLSISRILVFYPFFLLGFYVDSVKTAEFGRKYWVKIAAAAILAAVMLYSWKNIDDIYWTMRVLKGKDPYQTYAHLKAYGGILRLIHFVGSSVLSFSVFALVPERKFFFSVIGQRTMTIYALHFVCIDIFYGVLKGGRLAKQIWPEHYNILLAAVGVLIVVVLSWKPLDQMVTWVISPKKAE